MIWNVPKDPTHGSFLIPVQPMPDAIPFCCLDNCKRYVSVFGGQLVEGCYVLKHNVLNILQLVRHYVVMTDMGWVDPTPFDDCRPHNIFVPHRINTYNIFIESLENINIDNVQETKTMYYVYCYIDPTTQQPLYVGKGKQQRAYVHLHTPRERSKNKNTTRFKNKLEKLKQEGIEPIVVFLAQNIQEEETAYQIEESFIRQYGRKGYEEAGVLLNVCLGSRPPSHKHKTYHEIYGDRAEEQRLKRKSLQHAAGGWFRGRTHSDEAKKKISAKSAARALTENEVLQIGKRFCSYFDNKISKSRWYWWTKQNDIPPNILQHKSRFAGTNALTIFSEKFGASVQSYDSLLWFHCPTTHLTYRVQAWELKYNAKQIPEGFVQGRGVSPFAKSL